MHPMFRFFSLLTLILTLWGCSSSKSQFVYDDAATIPSESTEVTTEPVQVKKAQVDNSQPATFDDYREWRKANDPSGQTYAEYKEWEAAYKQWIENQAKAARQ